MRIYKGIRALCALSAGLGLAVAGASTAAHAAPSAQRAAVITTDGTALVQEGALSSKWVSVGHHISQIALSGLRIGVVTDAGVAYVKSGAVTAPWQLVARNAASIALSGTRIAVVSRTGTGRIKDGKISAPWVRTISPVRSIALTTTRIGWIRANGLSYVAADIGAKGMWQAPKTRLLVLADRRVAILDSKAQVGVKAGSLTATFARQTGVKTPLIGVGLAGDRIGVVTATQFALAKSGSVRAKFTNLSANKAAKAVTAIAMSGQRIAVVRPDHTALAKQGGLQAPWVVLHTDVRTVVLPTP